MSCIFYSLLLILRGSLTIVKKIFSFIIFPFVYPFRNKIYRSHRAYAQNMWEIDKILTYNNIFQLFIWFFFDDSIYSDYGVDYHPTRHKCKLAEFICKKVFRNNKTICDFIRSWYWAGIRNASNNFSHFITYKFVGRFIDAYKSCIDTDNITYELRQFEHRVLPYFELRFTLGKKNCYINIGWLHNGKFEGPKIRCRGA